MDDCATHRPVLICASLRSRRSSNRQEGNRATEKSYFFPFLRAAQYFFILSETALRAAELILLRPRRFFAAFLGTEVPDPGGRPLRGMPLWRTSIARFRRSRSSISNARTSDITTNGNIRGRFVPGQPSKKLRSLLRTRFSDANRHTPAHNLTSLKTMYGGDDLW